MKWIGASAILCTLTFAPAPALAIEVTEAVEYLNGCWKFKTVFASDQHSAEKTGYDVYSPAGAGKLKYHALWTKKPNFTQEMGFSKDKDGAFFAEQDGKKRPVRQDGNSFIIEAESKPGVRVTYTVLSKDRFLFRVESLRQDGSVHYVQSSLNERAKGNEPGCKSK